jgi:hypothetical protein
VASLPAQHVRLAAKLGVPSLGPWPCSHCGNALGTLNGYLYHVTKSQTCGEAAPESEPEEPRDDLVAGSGGAPNKKADACPHCQKAFKTAQGLRYHVTQAACARQPTAGSDRDRGPAACGPTFVAAGTSTRGRPLKALVHTLGAGDASDEGGGESDAMGSDDEFGPAEEDKEEDEEEEEEEEEEGSLDEEEDLLGEGSEGSDEAGSDGGVRGQQRWKSRAGEGPARRGGGRPGQRYCDGRLNDKPNPSVDAASRERAKQRRHAAAGPKRAKGLLPVAGRAGVGPPARTFLQREGSDGKLGRAAAHAGDAAGIWLPGSAPADDLLAATALFAAAPSGGGGSGNATGGGGDFDGGGASVFTVAARAACLAALSGGDGGDLPLAASGVGAVRRLQIGAAFAVRAELSTSAAAFSAAGGSAWARIAAYRDGRYRVEFSNGAALALSAKQVRQAMARGAPEVEQEERPIAEI